jgi:hypothetical protein
MRTLDGSLRILYAINGAKSALNGGGGNGVLGRRILNLSVGGHAALNISCCCLLYAIISQSLLCSFAIGLQSCQLHLKLV